MKAIKGIEKSMTVGSGTSAYQGVSDKDVKLKISDAMETNGLCILPISVEGKCKVDRWDETTQYGTKSKQSIFTEVTTKYLLLHESGESKELGGYGHGVDSQDKGAGKATTYALKNCLLYTFMVATGTIDDTDKTHSDDLPVPQKDNRPMINTKAYNQLLEKIQGGDKDVLGKAIAAFQFHPDQLIVLQDAQNGIK